MHTNRLHVESLAEICESRKRIVIFSIVHCHLYFSLQSEERVVKFFAKVEI